MDNSVMISRNKIQRQSKVFLKNMQNLQSDMQGISSRISKANEILAQIKLLTQQNPGDIDKSVLTELNKSVLDITKDYSML